MGQSLFVFILNLIRIAGSEIYQIERLVHKFLWQMQLSDALLVVSPFARSAPVFRCSYNSDARVEFCLADFPSPDDNFCIEPLADGPSAFVRHFETVVLIEDFAARVNFNLLPSLFFLEFRIELLDEIALQRIERVVTHDARNQD